MVPAPIKTRARRGRLLVDEDAQSSWMQHQGLDNAGIQAHYTFVLKECNAPSVRVVLREIGDRRPQKFAVTLLGFPGYCLEDRVYDSSSDPWI